MTVEQLDYMTARSRMKAGDVDRTAEIVGGTESVGGGMGDQFVQEGLPIDEIRIVGQRQAQPIRRFDERHVGQT